MAHERLTLWLDVLKWAIPAISAAILVPVLNWQFQDAELRQDAQLRQFELQLKKQEIEGRYLAQFVTHALTKDYETKTNFAHYFATLTVNEELKTNWARYYGDVVKQRDANIAELESKDKLRLKAEQERDKAQARIEELNATIEGLTQAGSDMEVLQEKRRELGQALIENEHYRESIEIFKQDINRLKSQTFSKFTPGQVEAEREQVEKQLHEYRIQLLRKVVGNLENTRDAVQQYTLENWEKVIDLRDGNRAVEELLSLMLNVGLLPPSLADDLVKLRKHYKEWLDAYKSHFPDGVAQPHRELIFVGTFPTESAASIRRCLADLEAGRADCRY